MNCPSRNSFNEEVVVGSLIPVRTPADASLCAKSQQVEHINEVQETDLLEDSHCINENARSQRLTEAANQPIDLILSNNHTLKTIQSDSIVAGDWA